MIAGTVPGTYRDIAAITRWLDDSNVFMSPELDDSMRIMKIGEEFGEVIEAYIGMTGQNPRKGVTHDRDDVLAELADVVVTAMCAIQHMTQDSGITQAVIEGKVRSIMARSGITTEGGAG